MQEVEESNLSATDEDEEDEMPDEQDYKPIMYDNKMSPNRGPRTSVIRKTWKEPDISSA
jgi:hypothetical protein